MKFITIKTTKILIIILTFYLIIKPFFSLFSNLKIIINQSNLEVFNIIFSLVTDLLLKILFLNYVLKNNHKILLFYTIYLTLNFYLFISYCFTLIQLLKINGDFSGWILEGIITFIYLLLVLIYFIQITKSQSIDLYSTQLIETKYAIRTQSLSVLILILMSIIPLLSIIYFIGEDASSILSLFGQVLPLLLIFSFWIISFFKKKQFLIYAYFILVSYLILILPKIDYLFIFFNSNSSSGFVGAIPFVFSIGSVLLLVGYLTILLLGINLFVKLKINSKKI